MSTDKIKDIINQYFDNELTKGEEIILFTQLSNDDSAREYFKEMNLLRTTTESTFEEYPDKMDEKIFAQIKSKEPVVKHKINRSRVFEVISYGFAILLLAISFFFYNESIQYRSKLEVTSLHVNQQNKLIKVLFNSLPQAEVTGKLKNEVIVTSQM